MKAHLLAVTMSAAFLTCAAIPVTAQQPPGGSMMPQAGQEQTEHSAPDDEGMMRGGMMGRGMMGDRGMMGHGMMGRMSGHMLGHRGMMHPLAMRMIFALMDADGDGKISLQEWQAAHERLFKAMDTDHDGTVTLEEMEAFMHGTRAVR
jgi:EF hand